MRLFVYGTLKLGGAAEGMLAGCECAGAASVRGTLYDVGGRYPALVLDGFEEVTGEVWICPDGLLSRLDEYEGVEEELFRRVRAVVSGEPCWVYVAGPRLAAALQPSRRVSGGAWPLP